MYLIPLLVWGAVMSCCVPFGRQTEVTSPDGRSEVSLDVDDEGRIFYRVLRDGRELIRKSMLGLQTREYDLEKGFEILDGRTSTFDEEWQQPWGENKSVRNHYNELAVTLGKDDGGRLTLRFRLFDDGLGLRYEWELPTGEIRVERELTEFDLAADGESWAIPANFDTYELDYRHMPLGKVSDANTPFTFKTTDGIYGSIHEAALYDYPEMVLRRNERGVLAADLAPLPDGVKAYVPNRFTTPWRTIQLGDRAVDLINSALILNLNEPSKIEDTSWIRPHKYVGVWWGMHLGTQTWTMGPHHGATTENALRHIDFAAENNLGGVLFEGWNRGWENWGGSQSFDYMKPYPDFDVERIAEYAREKGIELWMHNETGGNIPEYESLMEQAMGTYAKWGVHTLKTGYAGGFKEGYLHHSQYGVRHYQRVVECAARHHLMIDAHEPIKDTGIRRTWPNMMTREGARGMEWNAWSEGNSAVYLSTLPFVRLLGGPMDYTPGIFDIDYSTANRIGRIPWNGDNSKCCVKTTLARQLANWVIIYSPLQMASDLIENYENHPAFRFFRDLDVDCDWSKALEGEIGEYIVVARRAKDRFFVGAGTDDRAREVKLKLDFLSPGVTYRALIYADDPASDDPESYLIREQKLSADDVLEIRMAAHGGCAVSFIPEK